MPYSLQGANENRSSSVLGIETGSPPGAEGVSCRRHIGCGFTCEMLESARESHQTSCWAPSLIQSLHAWEGRWARERMCRRRLQVLHVGLNMLRGTCDVQTEGRGGGAGGKKTIVSKPQAIVGPPVWVDSKRMEILPHYHMMLGGGLQGVDAIDWPEGFCRRDIGWRALARLPAPP